MRIATVVLPVPGLPVKHMCSDGACVLPAPVLSAQLVDDQQRGDVADALLHRHQADQVAVELVHHRFDLALRQHLGHGARRWQPARGAGGRRAGGAAEPGMVARCGVLGSPVALGLGLVGGVAVHRVADLRPSASWRTRPKPGSLAGRLTMKLIAIDSTPRVLNRRPSAGCSGSGKVLRQAFSSIITPAASFRSNIGMPNISQ
jgi:hypothetical protein